MRKISRSVLGEVETLRETRRRTTGYRYRPPHIYKTREKQLATTPDPSLMSVSRASSLLSIHSVWTLALTWEKFLGYGCGFHEFLGTVGDVVALEIDFRKTIIDKPLFYKLLRMHLLLSIFVS